MHPYNDSQVASQLKNDMALIWALVIFHVANLLLNQESEKLYMVPISFCKMDIVLKEQLETGAWFLQALSILIRFSRHSMLQKALSPLQQHGIKQKGEGSIGRDKPNYPSAILISYEKWYKIIHSFVNTN
jgi:hypothetical protein